MFRERERERERDKGRVRELWEDGAALLWEGELAEIICYAL